MSSTWQGNIGLSAKGYCVYVSLSMSLCILEYANKLYTLLVFRNVNAGKNRSYESLG